MANNRHAILGLFLLALVTTSLSCQKPKNLTQAADSSSHQDLPVFDPPVFEYGSVLQDERIEHNFRLVNRSTNEVRVALIQTSCSCTTAHADGLMGKAIPPQGELVIPVSFDTGTRDGDSESIVYVSLVDIAHSTKYLVHGILHGEIVPDFTFEPKGLNFGSLRPGQSATQTVTFHPGHLKDFQLFEIQAPHPHYTVSNQHASADSTNADIVVSVIVQAPEIAGKMELDGVLRAETSSKRFPKIEIPLASQVVADEVVSPDTLVFSSNVPAGESRLTVSTTNPSRVVRVSILAADGVREVLAEEKAHIPQEWGVRHDLQAVSSAICGAKQLDVELLVQRGSGQPETRSVSVKIASLK